MAERDNKNSLVFPDYLSNNKKNDNEALKNEKALFAARRETLTGRQEMINSFTDEIDELQDLLKDGFVDKQRIRDLKRRKNDLQNQISAYKAEIIQQLTQLQTKVADLKERETALEDRLSRTLVTAPESGMVLGMKAHTIGGVIRSGDPILDIVPESSELIVEARVSPMDIDRVSLNSLADIRFSAFKMGTTPVIEGKVIHLSADRLTDEQTGMPYYLAKLEITKKGLNDLANLQLLPGMPAEVLIKTGERTLLQYLIQPATDGFAKAFIED
jgi:epimerase transport system membrane fusion protein